MHTRLLWATLFAVAAGWSGGCVCTKSALQGIPVRRLPDEVLYCPCPNLPVTSPADTNPKSDSKQEGVTPASNVEFCPDSNVAPKAVFYTGGILGGGEYPLTPDLHVVEAIAVAHGPIHPGLGRPRPSLVTVVRRLPTGQQLPIRVNLNEALRDSRENILIWPGDLILLQETPCEKTCRWFSRGCCK